MNRPHNLQGHTECKLFVVFQLKKLSFCLIELCLDGVFSLPPFVSKQSIILDYTRTHCVWWRYLFDCLLTKGASLKRHLATILLKKKIIQQFYRVKETSWLSLLLQQKDILRICHTADILIGPTKQSCKASWPIFTIIAGGILLLLWDFFVGFMMLYSFQ